MRILPLRSFLSGCDSFLLVLLVWAALAQLKLTLSDNPTESGWPLPALAHIKPIAEAAAQETFGPFSRYSGLDGLPSSHH